jgi:hypothetical protein
MWVLRKMLVVVVVLQPAVVLAVDCMHPDDPGQRVSYLVPVKVAWA